MMLMPRGRASSCVCLVFILLNVNLVCEGLEPITTGVAVGTAVLSSALFASYDVIKCKFYECCETPWIQPNYTGLQQSLKSKLHGQHLVIDTVMKAVKSHMNQPQPNKALVLSFHGWTGGGKNFVSRIITENLFKKGMSSKFVHLFVSTLHFPHESLLETYKDQLRDWIKGNVTNCQRSVFVFDEMDKMPIGLVDTVKPYIDYYTNINGVDYRKSIFIFLSNTGGTSITKYALSHWESGNPREDMTHKELEELINIGAFNEQGGLWHSSLIEKNLISVFVPFLPMERKHVKMCIKDDLKQKGHVINEEIISKVADELQYFPSDKKLFSKSGCKRVSQKVDLIMEDYDDEY